MNQEKISEQLFLYRYTFPVWKKLFTNADEESWKKANCPYSISEFIMNRLVQYVARKSKGNHSQELYDALKTIKIVTLEDEFLKNHNNKKFSEWRYGRELSDEDLIRLMQNSEMNKDYTLCMLMCHVPVTILHESDTILNKKAKDYIRKYLSEIYGKGNVYFPGYILSMEAVKKNEEKIFQKADIYFCEGTCTLAGEIDDRQIGNGLFKNCTRFLPFVVKGVFTNPIIDMEQWNHYSPLTSPGDISLDTKSLKELGLNVLGIEKTDISKLLCDHMKVSDVNIDPQVFTKTFC